MEGMHRLMTGRSCEIRGKMSEEQCSPTPASRTPSSFGRALYITLRVIVVSRALSAAPVTSYKFADTTRADGT